MSKIPIKKFLSFLILIILLGISLSFVKDNEQEIQNFTIDGTLLCLPFKDQYADDLREPVCILGIRSFNDEYYSLELIDDTEIIDWDAPYRIIGTFSEKKMYSMYESQGHIIVTSITNVAN